MNLQFFDYLKMYLILVVFVIYTERYNKLFVATNSELDKILTSCGKS